MGRMTWQRLLCESRVRELMGGTPSAGDDHRTAFQRDFDRVVFSSPVRRLQDKTQVFPLDPNDAVRTRLTHSLEVSSVARGIADKACQLQGTSSPMFKRRSDIEVIAATTGLVHDLGNPPFGHFGEASISEWFKSGSGHALLKCLAHYPQLKADFVRFEGNARTIRLLCSLQVLTDSHGLNLTAATVSATMKYTASGAQVLQQKGAPAGQAGKKPGFCFAEYAVVEKIRAVTGTGSSRHPIAYLVEAADDCVYSLCDLEDAVKKGVLSWNELKHALRKGVAAKAPRFRSSVNKLLASVEGTVTTAGKMSVPLQGQSLDYAHAQWLRIRAATLIVNGAARAFSANYEQIMSGTYNNELVDDAAAGLGGALVAAAKHAGQHHVYVTRQNTELEMRGRAVLQDLLSLLSHGVIGATPEGHLKDAELQRRAWSLLSQNYRAVFASSWRSLKDQSRVTGIPIAALEQYYRLLLLTDYVGGMTDTFACTLHQSLNNGR